MTAETFTWTGLLPLPLPPTWAFSDVQPLIAQSDESLGPPTLNGTELLSDETTISFIGQMGTPSLIRFFLSPVDPMSEREADLWKLISEIKNYRSQVEPQDQGSWNVDAAIEDAVSLVSALPPIAPLPRPMLLSERVAIYWDFGDAYAEIDFDGSGCIDAYAKRSGSPDLHLDRFPIASAEGHVSFPSQIETMISSAKDVDVVTG